LLEPVSPSPKQRIIFCCANWPIAYSYGGENLKFDPFAKFRNAYGRARVYVGLVCLWGWGIHSSYDSGLNLVSRRMFARPKSLRGQVRFFQNISIFRQWERPFHAKKKPEPQSAGASLRGCGRLEICLS
jgi:hypothetical protein